MKTKLSFLDIKNRPFELFGLCALILFIFFLIPFKQVLGINLHDTYFVIAIKHLFFACAVAFLVIWTLYILTSKFLLSNKLTWAHSIATVFAVTSALIIASFDKLQDGPPTRYYTKGLPSNTFSPNTITILYLGIIAVFFIGQLLFLVNITAGLIKRGIRKA